MKFSVCLIFPLGSCFVEPFHADLWIKLLILDFASFAGWASRRSDGIVPAKSIQKPREQKNSSGDRPFILASVASVFHASDFLPLLRRVIRKSGIRALEQFLLTFPKIQITNKNFNFDAFLALWDIVFFTNLP